MANVTVNLLGGFAGQVSIGYSAFIGIGAYTTVLLALKGVKYRPLGAAVLLRRNLLVYGLGGILIPFAGIKLIDVGLVLAHLA